MTKGSILQKAITTLSVYWPSNRVPNYMWQKLPEQPEEIDEYLLYHDSRLQYPFPEMNKFSR